MGVVLLFFLAIQGFYAFTNAGLLTPKESESRTIQEMNGMWNFRADKSSNRNKGMEDEWWNLPLTQTGDVIPMPVPSSFNDITTDKTLQYFTGWVWYDKELFVTKDQQNKRTVLRIDSAHYFTIVWVNGKHVMEHNGGHLPFEADVSQYVRFGDENRVTVAVNNTLGPHTLPPGTISYKTGPQYPPGYFVQNLQFDFFNYAGIHRRVRIYTTPKQYISDIVITTQFTESTGSVQYRIDTGGNCAGCSVTVDVLDTNGHSVVSGKTLQGQLTISNVHLWWPYTMSRQNFTYMYTLKAVLTSSSGEVDVYRQPFGVRTVSVTKTQILINGKPFYCHGVAKHEDSNIRGKGLDFALIARDFNMLRWLGVNCFRTSHYPYAEEIMDEADRWGIVVIDECPGVGITSDENFSNKSLEHHLEVMTELVSRDKNRPSVALWSVANEPASNKQLADYYFKTVIAHTKSLDRTRLVTFVSNQQQTDQAAQYTDVQCFNRYFGWYEDTGHLETIPYKLQYDLEKWYGRLKKPLMITEYGADTVPGIHSVPTFVFTEDYQVEFLAQYHTVFDVYRHKFLAGEMIWNFADFMTDQTVTRVYGNKKGLLTRERQPKESAHQIRRRYWSLINNTTYTQQHVTTSLHSIHDDQVLRFNNHL